MLLDEYVRELDRVKPLLSRMRGRQVFSQGLRHQIRAIAETWPNTIRTQVAGKTSGNERFRDLDELSRKIIEATYHNTTANRYLELLATLRQAVVDVRVDSIGPAGASQKPFGDTLSVAETLETLNPAISDSYRQVLLDLQSSERLSLRGTANELREVLREVLEVLAPDELVKKESWYASKDVVGRVKPRPTYADRAKFIARRKGEGRNAQRQVSISVERADELLGSVVRSTYDRGSGAAHADAERNEIATQLRYVNAILLELLT